jgi:hypothetical protein
VYRNLSRDALGYQLLMVVDTCNPCILVAAGNCDSQHLFCTYLSVVRVLSKLFFVKSIGDGVEGMEDNVFQGIQGQVPLTISFENCLDPESSDLLFGFFLVGAQGQRRLLAFFFP